MFSFVHQQQNLIEFSVVDEVAWISIRLENEAAPSIRGQGLQKNLILYIHML
jgi:hypothetical protein